MGLIIKNLEDINSMDGNVLSIEAYKLRTRLKTHSLFDFCSTIIKAAQKSKT